MSGVTRIGERRPGFKKMLRGSPASTAGAAPWIGSAKFHVEARNANWRDAIHSFLLIFVLM
jgi:hypothetical protein